MGTDGTINVGKVAVIARTGVKEVEFGGDNHSLRTANSVGGTDGRCAASDLRGGDGLNVAEPVESITNVD